MRGGGNRGYHLSGLWRATESADGRFPNPQTAPKGRRSPFN